MMDRPLVVLDTETATRGGAPHLVELGAVRVIEGEIAGEFSSLVRPRVPIDPAVACVHGITDAMVHDAPDAREVLRRFFDWLGDDWMAAHNAPFDARVLAFECARCELPMPDAPWIDSLRLSRRHLAGAPDHKLATLCDWLGLARGVHHRALEDARSCAHVLAACVARMDAPVALEQLLVGAGAPITMPSRAPRAPQRLRREHRPLLGACAERDFGARVALFYSRPGEAPRWLSVVPHFLFRRRARVYLEGLCAASGTLKTYRLDRVLRVRTAEDPTWLEATEACDGSQFTVSERAPAN